MELQETKPDHFQDLIDHYSHAIFDQGVKEVLHRHTLNKGDYSVSDIDWDMVSELSDIEDMAPGVQQYSFQKKHNLTLLFPFRSIFLKTTSSLCGSIYDASFLTLWFTFTITAFITSLIRPYASLLSASARAWPSIGTIQRQHMKRNTNFCLHSCTGCT